MCVRTEIALLLSVDDRGDFLSWCCRVVSGSQRCNKTLNV